MEEQILMKLKRLFLDGFVLIICKDLMKKKIAKEVHHFSKRKPAPFCLAIRQSNALRPVTHLKH